MAKIVVDAEVVECTPSVDGYVKIYRNGKIEHESIPVVTFVNKRNEQINLGMSREVQECLGIPFSSFNKFNIIINTHEIIIRAQVEIFNSIINRMSNEVSPKRYSFFQRLKFLFGCNIINFRKAKDLLKELGNLQ